jgi:hypothetical protein
LKNRLITGKRSLLGLDVKAEQLDRLVHAEGGEEFRELRRAGEAVVFERFREDRHPDYLADVGRVHDPPQRITEMPAQGIVHDLVLVVIQLLTRIRIALGGQSDER